MKFPSTEILDISGSTFLVPKFMNVGSRLDSWAKISQPRMAAHPLKNSKYLKWENESTLICVSILQYTESASDHWHWQCYGVHSTAWWVTRNDLNPASFGTGDSGEWRNALYHRENSTEWTALSDFLSLVTAGLHGVARQEFLQFGQILLL
jgi:hypothetical protein